MNNIKARLVDAATAAFMDFVGVAPLDRFNGVHRRMHPAAHLPGAQSVVSIGMRYPLAMYENAGRTLAESFMAMDSFDSNVMPATLMAAALDLARVLEDNGHAAVPIAVNMYRVHPYKDIDECWSPDFRNEVAAVAAGHGEIGLHGVVITPRFGTRQMFTSVVTDAVLAPDPMYAGAPLCDNCRKCLGACRMHALDDTATDTVVVGPRTFTIARKDRWRCMWSRKFMLNAEMGPKLHGLDVTIAPPDGAITDTDVQSALAEKGRRGGLQTWYTYAMRECERECVPPHLRGVDLLAVHARAVAHTGAAT
ncbi:MAG: hypothetical protein NTV22_18415 [bacterium]|nr:hypothetical protein [bacterium]